MIYRGGIEWRKSLNVRNCFNKMLEKSIQITHLSRVALSDLELISIDGAVGARDERRKEDNLPFTDPAILRMRLAPDGLSLDMMIVRRESHG